MCCSHRFCSGCWDDHQEIRQSLLQWEAGVEALAMGLTHCPICLGLALLSAGRFMAHLLMASQLMPRAGEVVSRGEVIQV